VSLEEWLVVATWAIAFTTVFAGVATLSAVVLALRLQRLEDRRVRPRLEIAAGVHEGSACLEYAYRTYEDREELWVRVRVHNKSPSLAKGVELRLLELEGHDRPQWPFKVSNRNARSISVPPGFNQSFDLVWVKNTLNEDTDSRVFLAIVNPDDPLPPWPTLQSEMERGDDNHMDLGVDYDIQFAIIGENVEPQYFKCGFHIDVWTKAAHLPAFDQAQGQDGLARRVHCECARWQPRVPPARAA
jgi:hypothetical protein